MSRLKHRAERGAKPDFVSIGLAGYAMGRQDDPVLAAGGVTTV